MRGLGLIVLAAVASMAAPASAQAPLSAGNHFTGQLADSDPRHSSGQHFLCFRLRGAPGDRVAVDMQSTEFDPLLMTVPSCDPNVEALWSDDDGGDGLNARLVAVLGDAPVFLRATAGGFRHGHGVFDLRLERTQDFPAEVCLSNDPARRQGAVQTCTQLAGDRNQPVRVRAFAEGRLAGFALKDGDYAAVVVHENRTLALPDLDDEQAAEARLRRAQGYSGLGKHAEALADLDEADRLLGPNAALLEVRSNVLEAMGDSVAAAAALDRAIAADPDQARGWAVRAARAYDEGRWTSAIADFNEALRRDPEPGLWYFYRGRAHEGNDDPEAAIADLGEAVRRSPDMVNAWYVRGQLLEGQNRPEAALSDYNRALALSPAAEGVLDRRASLHLQLKNFDQAIADADRAAELSPDSADSHNGRCWARAVANRDLETARAACDRSLALIPDRPHVLDSRALVFFRQGRFEQAWADYDAAVRLDGDNAGYRYGRGLAALKLGRAAEGQADIVAALGLDADVARTYADLGLRPE